jgi:hypothetical protein
MTSNEKEKWKINQHIPKKEILAAALIVVRELVT